MRQRERNHELEKKIVEMIDSKDQEMVELGFAMAEGYITCYKDFMRMRDEYLPDPTGSRIWSDKYKRNNNRNRMRKIAKEIEAKRRLHIVKTGD